jgi:hypothetical protein
MAGKVIHVLFQAVLLLVFFVVLTPLGFLLRAMGTDYLARRSEPNAPSYWISRKP